jgi:O-methyltransferase
MPIVTAFLRSIHDGARNVLGERVYGRLRQTVIDSDFARKAALAEFAARDTKPPVDLAHLDDWDKAVALSLGIQYAYYAFIEGDVVEFGTCTGYTARTIARAMRASERDRPAKRLHLFDSFEGHPEIVSDVDKRSYEVRSGVWKPGYPRLLSKQELVQSCAKILPSARLLAYEGWFKDTLAQLSSGQRFAFVHFHADLYQSAIDAIGGLFQRGAITNGALICFSGFHTGRGDVTSGEGGAWRDLVAQYDVDHSPWRSYGALGNSFIVHDYRR